MSDSSAEGVHERAAILQMNIMELKRLSEFTNNLHVKSILQNDINNLETELTNLRAANKDLDKASSNIPKKKIYNVKLTTYGWDQTNSTVSLFITLAGIHNSPKENVKCDIEDRSVNLLIKEFDGKNYTFAINNLAEIIIPSKSFFKIKKDTIVIQLEKGKTDHWDCLTLLEKQAKEKQKQLSKMDTDYDGGNAPADNLMKMMQRIYEDGDDEMKRTMAKAWSESLQKKAAFD